jgi:hypothetical protein
MDTVIVTRDQLRGWIEQALEYSPVSDRRANALRRWVEQAKQFSTASYAQGCPLMQTVGRTKGDRKLSYPEQMAIITDAEHEWASSFDFMVRTDLPDCSVPQRYQVVDDEGS